jgi:hypothetical protein
MSLIFALPRDLFRNLVVSWIRTADVGRLDSATCTRVDRELYLSFICSPGVMIPNFKRFEKPYLRGEEMIQLDRYMNWVVKRKIAVVDLHVTSSVVLNKKDSTFYLQSNGQHVQNVYFKSPDGSFEDVLATTKDVLVNCPNILSAEIGEYDEPEVSVLVTQIAAYCPQLRELGGSGELGDVALVALGAGCPHLAALTSGYNEDATDAGLIAVARHGKLLRLSFQSGGNFTDEGLRAVAANSPLLQSIDLFEQGQLTDDSLIALGQHCHLLRDVHILSSSITSVGLMAIAAGCPLLEVLCFDVIKYSSLETSVEAIARGCPQLRSLAVTYPGLSAQAVLALAECCPLLERVVFTGEDVGDVEITALVRGCPQLTDMDIQDTGITMGGALAILEHCKNLKYVTLDSGDDEYRALYRSVFASTTVSVSFGY